jgi:hypothetical protein
MGPTFRLGCDCALGDTPRSIIHSLLEATGDKCSLKLKAETKIVSIEPSRHPR